jgi:hypothetical protein
MGKRKESVLSALSTELSSEETNKHLSRRVMLCMTMRELATQAFTRRDHILGTPERRQLDLTHVLAFRSVMQVLANKHTATDTEGRFTSERHR